MSGQAKRKILLFGPIGDHGGREVEVNIIARALSRDFDVRIFSTFYISDASDALKGLDSVGFSSIQLGLFKKYPLIRLFSYLKYWTSGRKRLPYAFVKNRLWLKIYNWRQLKLGIIKPEIDAADLVLAVVQPTSQYLREAIEFANQKNIPFLIRTTGTVRDLDLKKYQFLRNATWHIHHSESNAANLNRQIDLPYTIIDQCALVEDALLALPLAPDGETVFGFAGRLSDEKGIVPLIDYFLSHPNYQLRVAGTGPLQSAIEAKIAHAPNINLLGQFEPSGIDRFFAGITCLIIPSFEETGPLVGLEAMAAGRLIISTRVGAMPERLLGTGNDFWFEIESEAALGQAIKTVSELPADDKARLSTALREKYRHQYKMSAIAAQYQSLVGRFLENSDR